MAQNILQVSDILPENGSSDSSEPEEAKVLQNLHEGPTKEEAPTKNGGKRSQNFLEDDDHSENLKSSSKGLEEPLLAERRRRKSSTNSQKKKTHKTKNKVSKSSTGPNSTLMKTKENEGSTNKSDTGNVLDHSKEGKSEASELTIELASRVPATISEKSGNEKGLKESLGPRKANEDNEEDDDEDDDDEEEEPVNDLIRTKNILRDVFPTFLFSVIQLVQESIVLQFVGHYCESSEFAAVALGNLWINITGYVMIYGFTSALATLSAHASGKGNSREIGIQLHQCIFFTLVISGLATFLNMYVTELLVLIDQPPAVSAIVPKYTWPLALGLFPYALTSSTVNYLEAQQVYDPLSYSTAISFLFHPLLCWIFIGLLKWGIFGGGLALLIANIISFISLIAIVRFRSVYWEEIKDSVFWPSRDSLKNFSAVLRVGFSSLVLTCVEWWALEYTTMYAGWCGEIKLSAHTICLQLENIICMIASSFGLIIQTYAGNALGELNKLEFLAICRLGPMLGFVITGSFMGVIVVFRYQVARLFTEDEEIVKLTSSLILFNMLYGIFDTTQVLFASIMKGIGKYQVAIWSSIIPYYFIGIPLSYFFAFRLNSEDIKGIWVGITIGILLINVIFIFVLFRTNLKDEMNKFEEDEPEVTPPQEPKHLPSDVKEIPSKRSSAGHLDLVDIFLNRPKKKQFSMTRANPNPLSNVKYRRGRQLPP